MGQTLDAAGDVVVLAFDLVDTEIEKLPGQLQQVLESSKVQQAIKKSLLDFAKTRVGASSTVVSDEDAQKLLESVKKGVMDAGGDELKKRVENTSEYKQLIQAVEKFQKVAKSSALGVWVDRNKGFLYVTAAVLVVGGASVLYITKTGGGALDFGVNQVKGKELEIVTIGALTIKGSLLEFRPDARVVGGQLAFATKLEQVKVELKIGGIVNDGQFEKVQGAAVVKAESINLQITGSAMPQTKKVDLAMSINYQGRTDAGLFTVGVGAFYKDDALGANAAAGLTTKGGSKIGLTGSMNPRDAGSPEFRGMLTLDIPL